MSGDQPERYELAEDLVGKRLLEACVDELKALQDPWSRTSELKQDEAIRRLEKRIGSAVREAFGVITAGDFPAARATLSKVVFTANGVQGTIAIEKSSHHRHELADYAGAEVVVVMADPEDWMADMHRVIAEGDQTDLLFETEDEDEGMISVEDESAPYDTPSEATELSPDMELADALAALDVRPPPAVLADPDLREQAWAFVEAVEGADDDETIALPSFLAPYRRPSPGEHAGSAQSSR